MNAVILENSGVNYSEGLERFSGKKEIYEKYLNKYISDGTFALLVQSMDNKSYEEAFKLAHSLKGMLGNLSINDLYGKMCEFVDCLRGGADVQKAAAMFPELVKMNTAVVEAIKNANN